MIYFFFFNEGQFDINEKEAGQNDRDMKYAVEPVWTWYDYFVFFWKLCMSIYTHKYYLLCFNVVTTEREW